MSSIINEVKFFFKELNNYAFETISSLIFYAGIIILVFWLSIEEESLSSFINLKGYTLWMLLAALYSAFIMNVKADISNKTLELLETMPTPYRVYLLKKSLARIPYDLFVMTVVFIALTLIFNSNGSFWSNYFDVLLTFSIFIPYLVSIALIVASLVLNFKRAEIAIILGNVVIIGLIYFLINSGFFESKNLASPLILATHLFISIILFFFASFLFDAIKKKTIKEGRLGQV